MRITSVSFLEDGGVVFEYFDPADMRENGISRMCALATPPGLVDDFFEELEEAAERALKQALEVWVASPRGEDEDDEPGYDNPLEREETR